jgi:hypothetical protein
MLILSLGLLAVANLSCQLENILVNNIRFFRKLFGGFDAVIDSLNLSENSLNALGEESFIDFIGFHCVPARIQAE